MITNLKNRSKRPHLRNSFARFGKFGSIKTLHLLRTKARVFAPSHKSSTILMPVKRFALKIEAYYNCFTCVHHINRLPEVAASSRFGWSLQTLSNVSKTFFLSLNFILLEGAVFSDTTCSWWCWKTPTWPFSLFAAPFRMDSLKEKAWLSTDKQPQCLGEKTGCDAFRVRCVGKLLASGQQSLSESAWCSL